MPASPAPVRASGSSVSPAAPGGVGAVRALWRTAARLRREAGGSLWVWSAIWFGGPLALGLLGDALLDPNSVGRLALQVLLIIPLTLGGLVLVPWRVTEPLSPETTGWALIRTLPSLLPVFLLAAFLLGQGLEGLLVLMNDHVTGPLALTKTWPSWVFAVPTVLVGSAWFFAWSRWLFLPLCVAAGVMGRREIGLVAAWRATAARRRQLLTPVLWGVALPLAGLAWAGNGLVEFLAEQLPGAQAGWLERGIFGAWQVALVVGLGPWLAVFVRLLGEAPPAPRGPARPTLRGDA